MLSLHRFANAILSILSALAIMMLVPVKLPAFQQPALSIGSGNSTGAYYAVSNAIAKIFNRKSVDYGIRLVTVESAGSVANIDSVLLGKTAFGIAQADMLQRAATGRAPWEGKPRNGLRAVLGLHVEGLTIVASCDRKIEHVNDLRGKRIYIEAPGSSDHEYAALLLDIAGVPLADVTLSEGPAVLAPELLQNGKIDAYIYTVGHPNLSVLESSTGKRKVRLVPLEKPLVEQLAARNPLFFPTVIHTDNYPGFGHQGTVPTIGARAVLFTRDDMSEETVYQLVREVMTNLNRFQRQHPLLRKLAPQDFCNAKVIPYHPGAERYFREVGLTP